MQHTTPATLVQLNIHMRRDHVTRLALLADKLAKRKGRVVRLGEALEAVLTAGFAWEDHDLQDLATPDKEGSPWLRMRPVHRREGRPPYAFHLAGKRPDDPLLRAGVDRPVAQLLGRFRRA